ncbi:MAG: Rpn family recombination-promoting nuclease/putative transposase, partial [Chloroflexota bacterium]
MPPVIAIFIPVYIPQTKSAVKAFASSSEADIIIEIKTNVLGADMSTFINPKNDYGFKIIFGNESRAELLVSFLNSLLYAGEPVIKSVKILNPYLPGDVQSLKDTFVDIQAVLNDGTIVIIEMQMTLKPDFFKRVLYNMAKKYGNQLDVGHFYRKLNPVLALVVADFVFTSSHSQPLTKFRLTDLDLLEHYPDSEDFQIAVVELPKFRKSADQLETLADMWLYFLRHAEALQEIPSNMSKIDEMNTAFEAARRVNLKALELEEIEKREKYAMSEVENLAWARDKARAAGLEEGRAEGREEGREE